MKKRDLIIVLIAIIFGLTYQYFRDGDIKFFDGCSRSIHYLRDKDFPNRFNLKKYSSDGIKRLIIENPAGDLHIKRGEDKSITISVVANIYSKDINFAKSIAANITAEIFAKNKKTYVKIRHKGDFPYSRARISIDIEGPPGLDFKIDNSYGNITIDNVTSSLSVEERYGNINILQATDSLDLNCRYSKVKAGKISGLSSFSAKYSYLDIEDSGEIEGRSSYSEIFLRNINTKKGVILISSSSKLNFQKIAARELNVKNSNGRIYLEDIDVSSAKIVSKNCKIKINDMYSGESVIKNSFRDISIKGLKGDSANILIKNLNMNFSINNKLTSLNISAKYSDIDLLLSKEISPFFDIYSTYGEIINKTPFSFLTTREKHLIRLSGGGRTPKIVVYSKYSDIKLKN